MIIPDRPAEAILHERLRATGRVLDPFSLARHDGPLHAEAIVIGTGAGGSAAFRELAHSGVDVIALEAGHFHLPHLEFRQREDLMMPELFWAMGARTDDDVRLTLTHGKGVGGGTVHNICLSEDTPPAILERWQAEAGLDDRWSPAAMEPIFQRVRNILHVGPIAEGEVNRNNAIVREGADALGWQGRVYDHNRVGCLQCGYCMLGCAYNRKQSALITYIPGGILAGGRLGYGCEVIRVLTEGRSVKGVRVRLSDPLGTRILGEIDVFAPTVVVAGSAVMTPALLHASGISDRNSHLGRHLRIHPAVAVAGRFDEEIDGWKGLPQSYVVQEFGSFYKDGYGGFLIIPLFGHPGLSTAMLPGLGAGWGRWLREYRHLSAATPLVHDETEGRIQLRNGRIRIRYDLDAGDSATLRDGIKRSAELYLAAGAKEVLLPYKRREVTVRKSSDLKVVDELGVGGDQLLLSSVHPQGTAAMAADPANGATDPRGRVWGWTGLWVADGSLFPSSVGVPPQLSIYAAGTRVAREILRERSLGGS